MSELLSREYKKKSIRSSSEIADELRAAPVGRGAGAKLLIPFDIWRTVVLLCLLSAGLMALAFPPLRWSWAAHLALVPMLLAIVRSPSRWSVVLGTGLAGMVFFGGEMYWLIMTELPSYIGVVLFCLLFWIGFGLLLRWTANQTRLPLALLAPIWWVSMEIGRSYALTGFPWLLLGQAQARTLVLLQSADVAGVYGLSALSAATAGLLVDLITRPIFLRYGKHIRISASLKYAAAGVAVFWIVALGYGIYRLRPVEMRQGPLVVTVQCSVPQEVMPKHAADSPVEDSSDGAAPIAAGAGQGSEKPKNGLKLSYEQLYRHTVEALKAHPDADLVVWPETMVPALLNREVLLPHVSQSRLSLDVRRWRNYWLEIHQLIAGGQTSLLLGTQAVVWHDAQNKFPDTYNSAILMRPDDELYFSRTRYDKVHLVPFGEYVPFRDSIPWLYKLLMGFTPYEDKSDYNLTPGDSFVRMSVAESRFAVPICFESSIARVCRQMVYVDGRKAVDFLANI